MSNARIGLTVLVTMLALGSCAASCSDSSPAAQITDPTLRPAAQATQFYMQAAATVSRDKPTIEALAMQIQQTAGAATQTQVAVSQRAIAQETAAQYTQWAVGTQAGRDATSQAVRDIDATATAHAQAVANLEGTQAARQQATATARVVQTQSTIVLETAEADAQRARIFNGAMSALVVVTSTLVLLAALIGWRVFVANQRKRGMVQRFGVNDSDSVLLIEDGAGGFVVLDHDTGYATSVQIQGGQVITAPLTPEAVRLLENGQKIKAVKAEHSPHAPAKPQIAKKTTLALGPLKTQNESFPSGEFVTLPRSTLPVVTPQTQLPPPERETLFVQDPANTLANRDASDKWEFITRGWPVKEGGKGQGLSRSSWAGKKFDGTGNRITPKYWEQLVDKLVLCKCAETDGRGEAHPIVPLANALDAFGLAHYGETPSD